MAGDVSDGFVPCPALGKVRAQRVAIIVPTTRYLSFPSEQYIKRSRSFANRSYLLSVGRKIGPPAYHHKLNTLLTEGERRFRVVVGSKHRDDLSRDDWFELPARFFEAQPASELRLPWRLPPLSSARSARIKR